LSKAFLKRRNKQALNLLTEKPRKPSQTGKTKNNFGSDFFLKIRFGYFFDKNRIEPKIITHSINPFMP